MNYKGRTVSANVPNKTLDISFPYDTRLVDAVRKLPDRKWDKKRGVWTVPYSRYHAKQVLAGLEKLEFDFDPRIFKLAEDDTKVRVTYFQNRDGLFPFQSEAVDFIHKNKGRVIIADDMGLGKTIESLAWIRERPDLQSILIVSPSSVVYKWEREIKKWVGEDQTVSVIRTGKESLPDSRFLIMSYAIMVSQQQKLALKKWDVMVLDEAHRIKSLTSQRARSAHSLLADHTLLLTGTPMLNRPMEMFSLLKMIDPVEWNNYFKFGVRYCDGHKNYFGWDFTGASNLGELKDRMKGVMIRRTKGEVLDQLPDLTRTRIKVEVRRAEITQALSSLQVWLQENGRGTKENRAEAMVRLTKLRQAIGLAKAPVVVDMVEDILEQNDSQKVVVYAVHHSVVAYLESAMKKWGVSTITGEVPQQDRQKRIDAFQNRHSPRVMIISSAGGEGIDLYRADKIIFCEREWVPGVEEQAEARCHRMGQKNAVEAMYLIASETVDRQMDDLIERKRDLVKELVGQDQVRVTQNSADEFMDMIKSGKF